MKLTYKSRSDFSNRGYKGFKDDKRKSRLDSRVARLSSQLSGNGEAGVSKDNIQYIYLTCHPDDFNSYAEEIALDILKSHDCIVCFTEDMSEQYTSISDSVDLERMSLFVIPVTSRFLLEPSRARDVDIPFAVDHHIPILPILVEPGIEGLYIKNDLLAMVQFLNRLDDDETAIPYIDKLERRLNEMSLDPATISTIRKAFDAYIFLSYRKKDRFYANQLMRIFHDNPSFTSVAMWFDEFLTPGESFLENIDKALLHADLFTLLVTPNILEIREDGPNFVMGQEYPAALSAEKTIVPVEMQETDKASLYEHFEHLPAIITSQDPHKFQQAFSEALCHAAIGVDEDDAVHNFLLGLAYREGIDVERNTERGLALIKKAADNDLLEAIETIYEMYRNGYGAPISWPNAAYWAEKLTYRYLKLYGLDSERTQSIAHECEKLYGFMNNFSKYLELMEKQCQWSVEYYGEQSAQTLNRVIQLADEYYESRLSLAKTIALYERAYQIASSIQTCSSESLVSDLCRKLAELYRKAGNQEQAKEFEERYYRSFEESLDEFLAIEIHQTLCEQHEKSEFIPIQNEPGALTHNITVAEARAPITSRGTSTLDEEFRQIESLGRRLINFYRHVRQQDRVLAVFRKKAELARSAYGATDIRTLKELNALASQLKEAGDKTGEVDQILQLARDGYALASERWGDTSEETLPYLENLVEMLRRHGDATQALALQEKAYRDCIEVLGLDDVQSQRLRSSLARFYLLEDRFEEALSLDQLAYDRACLNFGERDERLLPFIDRLLDDHRMIEAHARRTRRSPGRRLSPKEASMAKQSPADPRAIALYEAAYHIVRDKFGEYSHESLHRLHVLASYQENHGDREGAFKLFQKAYEKGRLSCGDDDDAIVELRGNLRQLSEKLGNLEYGFELCRTEYHIVMETEGEKSERALYSLQELARLSKELGRYDLAVQYGEKAYELAVVLFGDTEFRTVGARSGLAEIYHLDGREDKVLELYQDAYAQYLATHDALDIYSMEKLKTLTEQCLLMGRAEEAHAQLVAAYNDVMQKLEEDTGSLNVNADASLYNLARLFGKVDDSKRELELIAYAYKVACATYSETSINSLCTLDTLVEELTSNKRYDEAYHYAIKGYETSLALYGQDNLEQKARAVEKVVRVIEESDKSAERAQWLSVTADIEAQVHDRLAQDNDEPMADDFEAEREENQLLEAILNLASSYRILGDDTRALALLQEGHALAPDGSGRFDAMLKKRFSNELHACRMSLASSQNDHGSGS